MNKKNTDFIFTTLNSLYPEAKTELIYHTPFQLLTAVLLSAQTTDKLVNKVTEPLFKHIIMPLDCLQMGLIKLQKALNSINYYKTKAVNLLKTAEILSDPTQQRHFAHSHALKKQLKELWYCIPDQLDQLVTLPGVGIKTAKVILRALYNQPTIAADTHVHRVANRLQLVSTKKPEDTSVQLEKLLPDHYKYSAHHTLVLFGRYVCTAKQPHCTKCPFQRICPFYLMSSWGSRRKTRP